MLRLVLGVVVALLAVPAWGDTVRWSTITPLAEYEAIDPAFVILRSVAIPSGGVWTLDSGSILYAPAMVCHLWLNDLSGNPIHIPWVSWGTGNYLNIPPGLTVRGPAMFYFWCTAPGRTNPEPIFYSLEWHVTP